MLKTLTIIRLQSVLSGMFTQEKNSRKNAGTTALLGIVMIYVVIMLLFLFSRIFLTICDVFAEAGMTWLYFGFMGLMVFLLGFIGSVFLTQTQLFEAKDNELLLSMPVSPACILGSRLLSLLGINYIYELIIALPCGIVYCIKYSATVSGVILFALCCLLLPLLTLAVTALFSWIIAAVSSRMRRKNAVTLILTLVLFMGYMYLCFRWQHYIEKLAASGEILSDVIRTALPPFYWLGTAISEHSFSAFLIFAAFCILPAAAVYALLTVSFVRITSTKRGAKRIEYREKTMRVSGVRRALLSKELRHFLGSTPYMFNSGIGLLFLPISAVYALISRDSFDMYIALLDPDHTMTGAAVCTVMCLISSLIIISAPSISIEGRNMWLMKSLPVFPQDILLAKVMLHVLVSLPFLLISSVIFEFAFPMDFVSRIMMVLLPVAANVFQAFLGVITNLKYPKFDWINEAAAVKRGAAPTLSLFLAAGAVILPILLYFLIFKRIGLPANIFLCFVFAAFLMGTFLLYRFLRTKGTEMFEELPA